MTLKSLIQIHALFSPKEIELGRTDSILEKINDLEITQLDLVEIVKEIYINIFFFTNETGTSGMTLSNFISYAIDAKFIKEKDWSGSRNRNSITKKYRQLINASS